MNVWDWGGRPSPMDVVLGAAGRLLAGAGAGNPQVMEPAPEPEPAPPLRDRPHGGLVRFWWPAA